MDKSFQSVRPFIPRGGNGSVQEHSHEQVACLRRSAGTEDLGCGENAQKGRKVDMGW